MDDERASLELKVPSLFFGIQVFRRAGMHVSI
jgi:hypothetical protein